MTTAECVRRWLRPLATVLPGLTNVDWQALENLDRTVARLVAAVPTGGDQTELAQWHLQVRRELAAHGYTTATVPESLGGGGRHRVVQALQQFVCGWHDLDLRDATGVGHGALILDGGNEQLRRRWAALLADGALVGIAATERHGGSRIQEIKMRAVAAGPSTWEISGEKVWVSRLDEASAFVIFFRDPAGTISAAVVSADVAGLSREATVPAGLAGWAWGTLRLAQVRISVDDDLLGGRGDGLALFRRHFATFRPLVAATALGAAAGVHHRVTQALAARQHIGVLPRVRDTALVTLGRTHADLYAALTASLAAVQFTQAGDDHGELWSRVGKAHGVDTARLAVDALSPLVGASEFQADSHIVKVGTDLAGFRYADGIHDSLYRSGGVSLLAAAETTP